MAEKLLEHIACTSLHTELSTTDFPVHLSLMLSLSLCIQATKSAENRYRSDQK